MKLLEGKNAMVFGVANKRSIAWGITKALHEHGAQIGISYAGENLEKRVLPLAKEIGCDFVEPCDVSQDDQIEAVAKKAATHFGEIDILIHAIAFANRDELLVRFTIQAEKVSAWQWTSAYIPLQLSCEHFNQS